MSAHSVRQRLKNRADELGLEFQQTVQYYAIERFLYRLSTTQWSDRMILKGATMLRVWDGAIARPTRDIDFLGRFENLTATLEEILLRCVEANVPDDGLEFEQPRIQEQISLDGQYPGVPLSRPGHRSG